jgi:hypothetical protein
MGWDGHMLKAVSDVKMLAISVAASAIHQGGDEVAGAKDEVTASADIAGLSEWIFELNIVLDIAIRGD